MTDQPDTAPHPVSTVFEIALYRVRDGDAFAARHRELHDTVSRFAGFVGSEALRGHEQPDVFADVVEWRGIADAAAAAGQFAHHPVAEWFGAQCAEMIFFGHLERNPFVTGTGGVPVA